MTKANGEEIYRFIVLPVTQFLPRRSSACRGSQHRKQRIGEYQRIYGEMEEPGRSSCLSRCLSEQTIIKQDIFFFVNNLSPPKGLVFVLHAITGSRGEGEKRKKKHSLLTSLLLLFLYINNFWCGLAALLERVVEDGRVYRTLPATLTLAGHFYFRRPCSLSIRNRRCANGCFFFFFAIFLAFSIYFALQLCLAFHAQSKPSYPCVIPS